MTIICTNGSLPFCSSLFSFCFLDTAQPINTQTQYPTLMRIHVHGHAHAHAHVRVNVNPCIHTATYSAYEHVSSSSEYHPFNADGYDYPKPEIPLVYGFPNIPPLQSSPDTQLPSVTSPTEYNPTDLPTTVVPTDAAITQIDSTTFLSHGDSTLNRKKRSLFHSQPKAIEIRPTTTARPRRRYDDEGKWRIIQQEENKQPKKYDYL